MVGLIGDHAGVVILLLILICFPMEGEHTKLSIGAILDCNSIIGKEEKVAMELAVADINAFRLHHHDHLILHILDSAGDPVRVSSAAEKLISKHQVKAITGLNRWVETLFALQFSNESRIPIFSLATDIPQWVQQKWPLLINTARSQNAQVKAIAAVAESWKWRRVTIMYEETLNAAIPNLIITSLRKVNTDVDEFVLLPPFPSYKSHLQDVKTKGCRVFVVHTSVEVAANLFVEAKEMGMMEEEYVWITSDAITTRVDSLESSVISAMQGVLGIKNYYPCNKTRYKEFSYRFKAAFTSQFPNDPYTEPGTNPIQAYDAVLTLLGNLTDQASTNLIPGRIFLDSGESGVFQIINIVGKDYREIGYWSDGSGFSKSIEKGSSYSKWMKMLGQIHFPGGPWGVPAGPKSKVYNLRLGVPANTTFSDYVTWNNSTTNHPTGFSIAVFDHVVQFIQNNMDYYFNYTLIKIPCHYDSFVDMIYNGTLDGAIGDIAIVANRSKLAEFSQPYTVPGIQVVSYAPTFEKQWLFLKPFTWEMWVTTFCINLYNGFVVWVIERKNNPDFHTDRFFPKFVTIIWISFTTLFNSLQGDKLHTILGKMTMVVWLFVAIITTQTFTASLTSFLTNQNLKSNIATLHTLIKTNAKVGCDKNSFVPKYMEDVLRFKPENIMKYVSGDDYIDALKNKKIEAAILEIPYVTILRAKYCNISTGQIFKVGGFGFVFKRDADYIPDISEAILKISESETLQNLEKHMLSNYSCATPDYVHPSVGLQSFSVLYSFTVVISTLALVATLCCQRYKQLQLQASKH